MDIVQQMMELNRALNALADIGRLDSSGTLDMDRTLAMWPFKPRVPRRTKKALFKLDGGYRLSRNERARAERAIRIGSASLDRMLPRKTAGA